MNLPSFFEEDRTAVDAALDRLMPAENAQPPSIHGAMRYSVMAGGKRVRPILCLESARIFAEDVTPVLPVACALEFIHTYSLIHDDLPALDNDDLRRGKPTCHKKFGEATAILAGDSRMPRWKPHGESPSCRTWRPRQAPSTEWWEGRWRTWKRKAA
jgi:geranylgeranyl diphosphate synthase type II